MIPAAMQASPPKQTRKDLRLRLRGSDLRDASHEHGHSGPPRSSTNSRDREPRSTAALTDRDRDRGDQTNVTNNSSGGGGATGRGDATNNSSNRVYGQILGGDTMSQMEGSAEDPPYPDPSKADTPFNDVMSNIKRDEEIARER